MVELIYIDIVKEVEKIIKGLKYELKMRNPAEKDTVNFKEKLDNAKLQINIVELIEYTACVKLHSNRRQLNKCPFPDHKEKTASFKVYPDTNTFFCF